MSTSKRVLIVGGGIGGLTAAIALQRVGVEVQVVERAPAYAALGAGITVQTNAHAVLAALGVEFDARDVIPMGEFAMIGQDGRPLVESSAKIGRREHPSVNIRRSDLHETLLAACGESRVRLGRELVDLRADAEGVEVELAVDGGGRERERWDLVVGADGLRSAVRRAILPAAACELRDSGQTCWRMQLEAPDLCPTVTTEQWSPGRRVGVIPLARGGIYVYLVLSAPAGSPGPGTDRVEHLRERFPDLDPRLPPIFDRAERDGALIHHGDLCDHTQLHFGAGRVLLIGDAAHAMTPNLGQGAGMAIEDAGALALCWAERGGELDGLVADLEARRRERVAFVHRSSWRIGQVAHWRRPLLCRLRDALLRSTAGSLGERQADKLWAPGLELAERLRARTTPARAA